MIEIRHRITGKVLKTINADDLRWANLRWANLRGANLRWANLRGADLEGANTEFCTINFSIGEYEQAKQFIEGLKGGNRK